MIMPRTWWRRIRKSACKSRHELVREAVTPRDRHQLWGLKTWRWRCRNQSSISKSCLRPPPRPVLSDPTRAAFSRPPFTNNCSSHRNASPPELVHTRSRASITEEAKSIQNRLKMRPNSIQNRKMALRKQSWKKAGSRRSLMGAVRGMLFGDFWHHFGDLGHHFGHQLDLEAPSKSTFSAPSHPKMRQNDGKK